MSEAHQLIERTSKLKAYMCKHIFDENLQYDSFYTLTVFNEIIKRIEKHPNVQITRINIYENLRSDGRILSGPSNCQHLKELRWNNRVSYNQNWYQDELNSYLSANKVLFFYLSYNLSPN